MKPFPLLFAVALFGCQPIENDTADDGETDTESDTDTDTDSDSDTDTDSDTDADTDSDTDTDTDTNTSDDADGDGFSASEDCDDGDELVNPDADEVCGNGKDDDCDGTPGSCGFSGDHRVTDEGIELKGDRYLELSGYEVAVGDFDGDGNGDMAVGAPHSDSGGSERGLVYAVQGPLSADANLWEVGAAWTGTEDWERAGVVIASGDLDADGADELVVGAPTIYPDTGWNTDSAGAVYILSSALDGGDLGSAARIGRGTGDIAFGGELAIGDLTGDGVADLAVGSRFTGSYAYDGGAVYVFDDPLTASSPDDARTKVYGSSKAFLGAAVALPGDLDGDGNDDLVVSAPWQQNASKVYVGYTHVFFGPLGSAVTADDADASIVGHYYQSGVYWPGGVTSLGDTDEDGLGDLLLATPFETSAGDGSRYQGGVYVVGGSQLSGELDLFFAQWKATGPDYEYLGISVDGRDLDGDGRGDVLAGAVGNDNYASYGGAVYLWYATSLSGTGSISTADASWYGTSMQDYLGQSVATGDVTGDSVVDLVFGASQRTGGASYSGSVFVVPGSGF